MPDPRPTPDFGKLVVYTCLCGAYPCRPLHGPPAPCERCGGPLDAAPRRVEDGIVHARHLLLAARGVIPREPYLPGEHS